MLNFLISALAVWRISSLLVKEDGPGDVFAKLRNISGVKYNEYSVSYGTNVIAKILLCVWCCSVWVAFFVALLDKPVNIRTLLRALALSSSAIIIDEVIGKYEKSI
jgi:hypothetical protein